MAKKKKKSIKIEVPDGHIPVMVPMPDVTEEAIEIVQNSLKLQIRRAVGEILDGYLMPGTEVYAALQELTRDVMAEGLQDGLFGEAVRHAVDVESKDVIEDLVCERMPNSKHYAGLKDEVTKYLERFPAIHLDENLQTEIAKTIMKTFQHE